MVKLQRFDVMVNGKEAVWADGSDLWDDIVPILNHFGQNAKAGDTITVQCRDGGVSVWWTWVPGNAIRCGGGTLTHTLMQGTVMSSARLGKRSSGRANGRDQRQSRKRLGLHGPQSRHLSRR